MADKTQHKIGRNRPPRVQITYDVEIGDSVEVKELPFVIGVLADLAGDTDLGKLKDRKFVQVDCDNFDEVMASLEPALAFTVPNRIDDTSENIPVELKFHGRGDFDPMSIISQVDKMKESYEQRNSLNALLAKLYVNDDLSGALNEVIASSASDEELKSKLQDLMGKL